jgi:hypothetical protein
VKAGVSGLALIALFLAAGCGGGKHSGSGELRIREIHVAGAPSAIEGEYTYAKVDGEAHRLSGFGEARFHLAPGDHTLEVWHRTCDGNCGHLDAPGDRCKTSVSTEAGEAALATIHNSPGSPCRIVVGKVGIAYVQRLDGGVWFAAPNGSRRVRLAVGSTAPWAALSPDGALIAFARSVPKGTGLYVVSTAGGKPKLLRRVTGFRSGIGQIVWAPDSERLVSPEAAQLVLVDARGGRARPFAFGGPPALDEWLDNPTFSRAGVAIAYAHHTHDSNEVLTYDIARRVTLSQRYKALSPVWGPERLVFNRGGLINGDLWLTLGLGIPAERLTDVHEGIYPVAWSADGTKLLAANPAMHNGRLWAVEVPSGDAHDLTGWVGDLNALGLSHDGKTVLASVGCGGSVLRTAYLETFPLGGGKPKVIVRGPCWASWNE